MISKPVPGHLNFAPAQNSIEILIPNAGGEWWQIVAALSPLVTVCAAALVAVIIWLRPRRIATRHPDRGTDWWERARWALDASLDEDPKKREVGLAALESLNASDLSGLEESQIIATAWASPLRDKESLGAAPQKEPGPDRQPKSNTSRQEDRLVVRAARLRLSTDKKQGLTSPSWVENFAKRQL